MFSNLFSFNIALSLKKNLKKIPHYNTYIVSCFVFSSYIL